jgi:hypothetical protein
MVASLLKVISSGIQDERLSFKPSLYPFKKIWVKAGRFTTQWQRLDFENTPTFGNTAFLRLLRKGHLISRLVLVVNMPDIYSIQQQAITNNGGAPAYPQFGWTNSLGHALCQQITLDIAGSRVETLNSRLLEILDEFHTPLEKVPIVNDLIKRNATGFTQTSFGWPASTSYKSPQPPQPFVLPAPPPYSERVVVPLPFWFTRGDYGCALPIDAITADEVRVGITFRGINGLYYTGAQVFNPYQYAPHTVTPIPVNQTNDDGTALAPLLGSDFYTDQTKTTQIMDPSTGKPIQMPLSLQLGECYVMAEYIYLDQNEANRFRLADLQIPVVQHYAMEPFDSRGLQSSKIRLYIPNPTRDIYFMCNPYYAPAYNAFFLATRDLTGTANTQPQQIVSQAVAQLPWWPDSFGLYADIPALYIRPAFALSNSEPLMAYELDYQGTLVRYRTESPALFRSIIPSFDQRKSPFINRYYYNLSFGIQNGFTPFSKPQGEANLDKITTRDLVLAYPAKIGPMGFYYERCVVYIYAETYNMLRVYGGRAGMMFAY